MYYRRVLYYRTAYSNWADRHNFAIARGAKKGITIRCSGGCHDSKLVTQNVVVRSIWGGFSVSTDPSSERD